MKNLPVKRSIYPGSSNLNFVAFDYSTAPRLGEEESSGWGLIPRLLKGALFSSLGLILPYHLKHDVADSSFLGT